MNYSVSTLTIQKENKFLYTNPQKGTFQTYHYVIFSPSSVFITAEQSHTQTVPL